MALWQCTVRWPPCSLPIPYGDVTSLGLAASKRARQTAVLAVNISNNSRGASDQQICRYSNLIEASRINLGLFGKGCLQALLSGARVRGGVWSGVVCSDRPGWGQRSSAPVQGSMLFRAHLWPAQWRLAGHQWPSMIAGGATAESSSSCG